jgi:hypothetical protein
MELIFSGKRPAIFLMRLYNQVNEPYCRTFDLAR